MVNSWNEFIAAVCQLQKLGAVNLLASARSEDNGFWFSNGQTAVIVSTLGDAFSIPLAALDKCHEDIREILCPNGAGENGPASKRLQQELGFLSPDKLIEVDDNGDVIEA